jgi:hypothetical protein
MPKLDLTRARRIKVAGGELARLKGDGFAWVKPTAGEPGGVAVVSGSTGATVARINVDGQDFDLYEFAVDGSISFSAGGRVEVLVIGGGGAGGCISNWGVGGAGSGADVVSAHPTVAAAAYPITVGAGGTSTTTTSTSGADSAAFGLTARGGGYGGWYHPDHTYQVPVDGGGAGQRADSDSRLGAAHPTSFRGGDAMRDPNKRSGGGRGAGGDGISATAEVAGIGGPGIVSEITGAAVEYGAGADGKSTYIATDGPGAAATVPGCGGDPGIINRSDPSQPGGAGAGGRVFVRVPVAV